MLWSRWHLWLHVLLNCYDAKQQRGFIWKASIKVKLNHDACLKKNKPTTWLALSTVISFKPNIVVKIISLPVWESMWRLRWQGKANPFPQVSHTWLLRLLVVGGCRRLLLELSLPSKLGLLLLFAVDETKRSFVTTAKWNSDGVLRMPQFPLVLKLKSNDYYCQIIRTWSVSVFKVWNI